MSNSKALGYSATTPDLYEAQDFLSLNFILEMHSFLDNHSKMKVNPGAGFCNPVVSSIQLSQEKFLVSSAAA